MVGVTMSSTGNRCNRGQYTGSTLASLLHPKLKISLPHTEHGPAEHGLASFEHESHMERCHGCNKRNHPLPRTEHGPAEYGLFNIWGFQPVESYHACQTYSKRQNQRRKNSRLKMQIKQKNSYPNMISYVTLNYPSQLDFFLGHVKGKELCL